MRAFAVIVLLGIAAVAIAAYVGWDDSSTPTAPASNEPTLPTDEPTAPAPTDGPPEVAVGAAARKTHAVKNVVCHATGDVTFCAVTYVGPSCELWQVVDGTPSALAVVIEGAVGTSTGTGVRCEPPRG